MRKIEITIDNLLSEIESFYNYKEWHFLTLNGIDLGDKSLELQWIFSKYGVKDEMVIFFAITDYDAKIPSIVPLIPSAIMGEREVVDMFGIDIVGVKAGLYLDEDSMSTPLKGCAI